MSNAGATYFIKVYGSQRSGNRPKYSHTFATFTEVRILADGTEQRNELRISWLPQDAVINPLGGPEPGRNFTLSETWTWLDASGSDIRWESLQTEIKECLFDAAKARCNELAQGTLQYVMIDNLLTRPHRASNCIHAVTDLSVALQDLGMCYTGVLHGISASRFVYQYLSPYYVTLPETASATEQIFEQDQRHHFGVAAAMESLVDAHSVTLGATSPARQGPSPPRPFCGQLSQGGAVSRAASVSHLVYVHGIAVHVKGYSDAWWQALHPFTDAFGDGNLGQTRHEVIWSDLVNPRAAARTAVQGGQADMNAMRQRIRDVLDDRQSRQAAQASRAAGVPVLGRQQEVPPRSIARELGLPDPIDTFLSLGFQDFIIYMVDDRMRQQIIGRFTDVVRPLLASGARVDVISHSWGTVVAYEALRELESSDRSSGRVVNLFTAGSALSVWPVRSCLREHNKDGRRPAQVDRWINLDAEGDLVGGTLLDMFAVDVESLNLQPTGCQRTLWGHGWYDLSCAHGSYFQAQNQGVNRDIFARYIDS